MDMQASEGRRLLSGLFSLKIKGAPEEDGNEQKRANVRALLHSSTLPARTGKDYSLNLGMPLGRFPSGRRPAVEQALQHVPAAVQAALGKQRNHPSSISGQLPELAPQLLQPQACVDAYVIVQSSQPSSPAKPCAANIPIGTPVGHDDPQTVQPVASAAPAVTEPMAADRACDDGTQEPSPPTSAQAEVEEVEGIEAVDRLSQQTGTSAAGGEVLDNAPTIQPHACSTPAPDLPSPSPAAPRTIDTTTLPSASYQHNQLRSSYASFSTREQRQHQARRRAGVPAAALGTGELRWRLGHVRRGAPPSIADVPDGLCPSHWRGKRDLTGRVGGEDALEALATQGTTFPLWRSHSARTPRKGSASDPAPASQAEEGHSATQPEAAANSGDNSTSKRSSKQSHNKGAKGSTAAPSDGGGADGEARRAEELSRWKCLALWEREAPAMAATIIQAQYRGYRTRQVVARVRREAADALAAAEAAAAAADMAAAMAQAEADAAAALARNRDPSGGGGKAGSHGGQGSDQHGGLDAHEVEAAARLMQDRIDIRRLLRTQAKDVLLALRAIQHYERVRDRLLYLTHVQRGRDMSVTSDRAAALSDMVANLAAMAMPVPGGGAAGGGHQQGSHGSVANQHATGSSPAGEEVIINMVVKVPASAEASAATSTDGAPGSVYATEQASPSAHSTHPAPTRAPTLGTGTSLASEPPGIQRGVWERAEALGLDPLQVLLDQSMTPHQLAEVLGSSGLLTPDLAQRITALLSQPRGVKGGYQACAPVPSSATNHHSVVTGAVGSGHLGGGVGSSRSASSLGCPVPQHQHHHQQQPLRQLGDKVPVPVLLRAPFSPVPGPGSRRYNRDLGGSGSRASLNGGGRDMTAGDSFVSSHSGHEETGLASSSAATSDPTALGAAHPPAADQCVPVRVPTTISHPSGQHQHHAGTPAGGHQAVSSSVTSIPGINAAQLEDSVDTIGELEADSELSQAFAAEARQTGKSSKSRSRAGVHSPTTPSPNPRALPPGMPATSAAPHSKGASTSTGSTPGAPDRGSRPSPVPHGRPKAVHKAVPKAVQQGPGAVQSPAPRPLSRLSSVSTGDADDLLSLHESEDECDLMASGSHYDLIGLTRSLYGGTGGTKETQVPAFAQQHPSSNAGNSSTQHDQEEQQEVDNEVSSDLGSVQQSTQQQQQVEQAAEEARRSQLERDSIALLDALSDLDPASVATIAAQVQRSTAAPNTASAPIPNAPTSSGPAAGPLKLQGGNRTGLASRESTPQQQQQQLMMTKQSSLTRATKHSSGSLTSSSSDRRGAQSPVAAYIAGTAPAPGSRGSQRMSPAQAAVNLIMQAYLRQQAAALSQAQAQAEGAAGQGDHTQQSLHHEAHGNGSAQTSTTTGTPSPAPPPSTAARASTAPTSDQMQQLSYRLGTSNNNDLPLARTASLPVPAATGSSRSRPGTAQLFSATQDHQAPGAAAPQISQAGREVAEALNAALAQGVSQLSSQCGSASQEQGGSGGRPAQKHASPGSGYGLLMRTSSSGTSRTPTPCQHTTIQVTAALEPVARQLPAANEEEEGHDGASQGTSTSFSFPDPAHTPRSPHLAEPLTGALASADDNPSASPASSPAAASTSTRPLSRQSIQSRFAMATGLCWAPPPGTPPRSGALLQSALASGARVVGASSSAALSRAALALAAQSMVKSQIQRSVSCRSPTYLTRSLSLGPGSASAHLTQHLTRSLSPVPDQQQGNWVLGPALQQRQQPESEPHVDMPAMSGDARDPNVSANRPSSSGAVHSTSSSPASGTSHMSNPARRSGDGTAESCGAGGGRMEQVQPGGTAPSTTHESTRHPGRHLSRTTPGSRCSTADGSSRANGAAHHPADTLDAGSTASAPPAPAHLPAPKHQPPPGSSTAVAPLMRSASLQAPSVGSSGGHLHKERQHQAQRGACDGPLGGASWTRLVRAPSIKRHSTHQPSLQQELAAYDAKPPLLGGHAAAMTVSGRNGAVLGGGGRLVLQHALGLQPIDRWE